MLEAVMMMAGPYFGWLAVLPFYFLEILVGLVQALVFALLTSVFTALMCEAVSIPLGAQPVLSRQRLKTLTQDLALDCSALQDLGCAPTTTFEEGVAETVACYREAALIR